MDGRIFYLRELRYGFEENRFSVRLDLFTETLVELEDPEFRVTIGAAEELTVVVKLERGRLHEFAVEKGRVCLLNPKSAAEAAFERILEVSVNRSDIDLKGQKSLRLGVALWHGGLPVDVLPAEGFLEVALGDEQYSWPIESASPADAASKEFDGQILRVIADRNQRHQALRVVAYTNDREVARALVHNQQETGIYTRVAGIEAQSLRSLPGGNGPPHAAVVDVDWRYAACCRI